MEFKIHHSDIEYNCHIIRGAVIVYYCNDSKSFSIRGVKESSKYWTEVVMLPNPVKRSIEKYIRLLTFS